MSVDTRAADFFVAGGTLRLNAPSYVKRPEDDELLDLALAGEFCYVLTPRQMGKSSLMVRTARRLQERGVRTAIIDLTGIGTTDVGVEQWYLGLITRLTSELRLRVDPEDWWADNASLGAAQRFTDFLHDVVLVEIGGPVVIFIDEIDTTLNLGFSDDFFAAIRFTYNARASDPAYHRLTFVLLGVAAPADLIKDPARTPFNIGHRVDLHEFSREDAGILQQGLEAVFPQQGQAIFTRIYHWTNGHPYLTQRLCLAASEAGNGRWTDERVDGLVERQFLAMEARKEGNLQFVRSKILDHPQARQLLALYRKVYRGKEIRESELSLTQNQLRLAGLVKVEDGYLRTRNEIYRHVFDLAWIRQHTPVDWVLRTALVGVGVLLIPIGAILWNFLVPTPSTPTRTPITITPALRTSIPVIATPGTPTSGTPIPITPTVSIPVPDGCLPGQWCSQNDQNLEGKAIYALAGCDDGTLFAGASDGIYRRAPGGTAWELEQATNGELYGLDASPDCAIVYAAARNQGVLRRDNGSWSVVSEPDMSQSWTVALLENLVLAGGEFGVRHSAIGPDDTWEAIPALVDKQVNNLTRSAGRIYAATRGSGVWYCSEDNVEQWWSLNDGLETRYAQQAIGSRTDGMPRFVGMDTGFYRWNGTQWEKGPEVWGYDRTFWFAIDGDTVYAGQANNGVLRSTDGGLTWEQINAGWETPPPEAYTLLIYPDKDFRRWLYAGTSEGMWRYLLPRVPVIYPPPMLAFGGVICSDATFKWEWSGTLTADEWFAVRVGKLPDIPHSQTWTKERQYTYVLGESGDYVWEVAICRGHPSTAICNQLAVSERGTFSFVWDPTCQPPPR